MTPYTSITIIYNPHSTGPGKRLAGEFITRLHKRLPDQTVAVRPTGSRGHAETLAYELAMASKRPLIIAASGDGGYHEVTNGLLRAQADGATPTAGLLPAGNANDHYRSLHQKRDLIERIVQADSRSVDVLQLEYKQGGKRRQRYAHSYIGLGLTAQASVKLNQHNLNRIVEFFIVLGVIIRLRAVPISLDGSEQKFDSLVCSNIPYMSKFLSVSSAADPADGTFELTTWPRRHRLRLCWSLIVASKRGMNSQHGVTSFSFQTVEATSLQLDGETISLDADSTATISITPAHLNCLI